MTKKTKRRTSLSSFSLAGIRALGVDLTEYGREADIAAAIQKCLGRKGLLISQMVPKN